jgi:multidrug efflux pump
MSGSQAPALYAISMLMVFLCLAALVRELVGAGVGDDGRAAGRDRCGDRDLGRGLSNDVYFQVGLLTTVGLSAKNAILIVEFAKDCIRAQGKQPCWKPRSKRRACVCDR